MTSPSTSQLALHDAMALGEIEMVHESSVSELERLPLLLRILSSSRPLAGIPTILPNTDKQAEEENDEDAIDEVIQQAVERLEDRAALYSEAEGIEVVTSHLAPFCCRKRTGISKVKNIELLRDIAQGNSVVGSSKTAKKRKMETTKERTAATTTSASVDSDLSDHPNDDDDNDGELSDVVKGDVLSSYKRPYSSLQRPSHHHISTVPSQQLEDDSLEVTVTKTIIGLAQLIVESSQQELMDAPRLQQLLSDSILAQPRSKDILGNDLGSTVCAIMHYAPILKHTQVASALCRAAFPQSSLLIGRLGANCPAAVLCLLKGCIDAYMAHSDQTPIAVTSRRGIENLANLSLRECSRVRAVLKRRDCLLDLQLALTLRQSPFEAACMLLEHLSPATSLSTSHQSHNDDNMELESSNVPNNDSELASRSLRRILEQDVQLFIKTIKGLVGFLSAKRLSSSKVFQGDIKIAFRALGLIFYRIGIKSHDESHATAGRPESDRTEYETALDECAAEILEWVKALQQLISKDITMKSRLDTPFGLLVMIAFTQLSVVLRTRDGSVGSNSSMACLRQLLGSRISDYCDAFAARFAFSVRQCDCFLIDEVVVETQYPSRPTRSGKQCMERLEIACEFVASQMVGELEVLIDIGTTEQAFTADPRSGIELVRAVQLNRYVYSDRAKQLLCFVLTNVIAGPSFLRSDMLHDFIDRAGVMLIREDYKLPLISPIDIESQALRLTFVLGAEPNNDMARFILCLLYCLTFTEATVKSQSPIAFDLRALPLRHIRSFIDSMSVKSMHSDFRNKVMDLLDTCCPEASTAQAYISATKESTMFLQNQSATTKQNVKNQLLFLLRRSVDTPAGDLSGRIAERVFVGTLRQLGEADLCTSVVSAILSETNLPARFFTYSSCCRDPLVLLKCPIPLWRREGFRRMVLFTLAKLIDVNNYILQQCAPSDESREELAAARDALMVRSLITVASSEPGHCRMTLQLVRRTISKNQGLLALLFKQGLSNSIVDWLVEWVPEAIEDVVHFCGVLSDRCILTTAERLVVADGMLRIVIVHGHRHAQKATPLVYAALAQLVASFFLLVGPVGVPVNTLIGDGVGTDAAHISRIAAFRILNAMKKVSSYRSSLKNECFLALQKLAGLCKGEAMVSGLPMSIANRQKGFLKKLLDEINQTSVAMGCGQLVIQ